MDIFAFLSLAGGLALFLYGISLLGGGLEAAAVGRIRPALGRLTGSPLRGVLLGAAVTAAVQSSSAVTVIVVGLVGAEAVSLQQAMGVIMGANIGTTVTAHLLRLGASAPAAGGGRSGMGLLLRLCSPATLAPVTIILGTVLCLAAKKSRPRTLGQLLLGFGILFTGMLQMESAVAPLREDPAFLRLFSAAEDPLLGVLAGAGATAVIQSSSASVGILQAMASTGAVSWAAAVPILLGQNIGTCVTPILAGIGGNRGAKRTALVHLLFNLAGTAVFLAAIYGTGWAGRAPFWKNPVSKAGIARFHTLFNLAAAAMLLPFLGMLEQVVCRLVPEARPSRAPDRDRRPVQP